MNQKAVPPNRPSQPQIQLTELSSSTQKMAQETKDILKTIRSLTGGLRSYPIRELVKEAEDFGKYLKNQNVKTNQIRKFLDAINRVKIDLSQLYYSSELDFRGENLEEKIPENFKGKISEIETDIVMLKPKLAYGASRASKKSEEEALKKMEDVLSLAIDKIQTDIETVKHFQNFQLDFERLVNLIESIIAYHKEQGGE
ncbi:type III-A CRISPR-associated protein Csm2 [Microcystis aeruginosa BLCCF158]|uniref:CRISPR system Cms protein Csm2 n=2 Tax=Microcystis TaxID=1125 RepID=A0A841V0P5_MICAE|nr:type III-A CRISPR-associated protein Csm2 [Microcystis aeruginosa]MBC1195838.1 type III-A CRISPR-associated protein Csm2 [Microcystis aeruginosa BLCC-F158]